MRPLTPFRVLSLDGGGMRGIYQAALLGTFATRITVNLKRSNVIDIGKAFDLVVGTSTGGIVAGALTAGVPLEEVRSLYSDHGGQIFPYQWLRSAWLLGKLVRGCGLGLHRGDTALRSVLTQTFGTRTVREVYEARGIALAIPTVNEVEDRPIVHSDRGGHYRWPGWLSRVASASLVRSMSRKACSPDNAACEGLFGRLKTEMFYARDWRSTTIEQFIEALYGYIRWYNEKRIKLSLGYLSPIEYRESLCLTT